MEQIDAGNGTSEDEVDAITARLETVSVEGVAEVQLYDWERQMMRQPRQSILRKTL